MKKISLVFLCSVMLLCVCGCDNEYKKKDNNGNSVDELVGTWQTDFSEDWEDCLNGKCVHIYWSEEQKQHYDTTDVYREIIIDNVVKENSCGGDGCPSRPARYRNINGTIYFCVGVSNTSTCYELIDNETIKMVSCAGTLNTNQDKIEYEKDIIYKKVK